MKYFEISAKTGQNISKMVYSAIADLNFFEQFDIKDKNIIINELGKFIKKNYLICLENDNNKSVNLDNSTLNIVKNISSSNRNINLKESSSNHNKNSNKKNCNC